MTSYYLIAGFFLVIVIAGALYRSRHQGVAYTPGQATIEDVVRLARSGNKLMAIKAYREIHRVGLKEAKEAVEKL